MGDRPQPTNGRMAAASFNNSDDSKPGTTRVTLGSSPTYLAERRAIALEFIMAQILEPVVENSACYALSPLQEGMLVESLLARSSGVDITQVICTLPETIEPRHMQTAWQQTVDRHEALRTSFHCNKAGKAQQTVHTNVSVSFRVIDCGTGQDHSDVLEKILQQEREEGFNPPLPPLMRVVLLQNGAAACSLIWTFHHLIIDARSIAMVINEVLTVYEASAAGARAPLPASPPYRRFIEWLQELDAGKAERYWREQLKGFS